MKKKQFLTALLAGSLTFSLATPALAAESAHTVTPSYPILTQDGTQYIPLRAIAEDLGYTVSWDQSSLSATAKSGNTSIKLLPYSGIV